MSVAVIVPWRGGCVARERAWDRVRALYATRHPGWPLIVAEPPPGPWVKAAAVMPTALASEADILAIADADVWCDGLREAITAVQAGRRWAVPHLEVHRLTREVSRTWCPGARTPEYSDLAREPYEGVPGGGIVVIRRDVLERVPLDPRFIGWGGEDHAWGYALETLEGPPWRGSAPLIHLWHPPEPRQTCLAGSGENEALRRAYWRARSSRPRMQQLLDGARRHELPALAAVA